MKRRILTILLALCVALTMMPTVAMAAETPTSTPDFNDDTWTELTAEYLSSEAIDYKLTGGDSASNAKKYYLKNDVVEISKTINVTGYVVLDLNGHVLKMNSSIYGGTATGSVIEITSSGNLILQDSNPTAEHKFDTTNDLWVLAADNAIGEKIKTVTGGIITGGTGTNVKPHNTEYTYGGGVYVDLGNFTMNGGNIVGCSSTTTGDDSYGGGICAKGNYDNIEECKVNINGGNIIGCTAGAAGGGVFIENATVNMSGGNILNCTAGADGGGGVQIKSGTFTMSGGSIKYCKYTGGTEDTKGGGAVRIYKSGFNCVPTFNMSGGEITDCTSTHYGGGVFVNDMGCVFNMTGGTIKDCESNDENLSAGVYLRGFDTEMKADGGIIYDNVYVKKENNNKNGKIIHSSGTGCTAFHGKVTNNGTVEYGIFYGGITGEGTISGIQIDFMDGEALYAKQVIEDDNTAITQIDEPKKDGYTFDGWYSNGNEYKFGSEVTGDLSLTAKWTPKENYTVKFNTNGASSEAIADKTSVKWTDKLLDNITNPTKAGYRFVAWKYGDKAVTADTSYGELVADDSIVSVELQAQWQRISSGSIVQKPSVSLGTDAKTEKAADGSTIYTTAEGSIVLSRDGRTAEITPADGYEVANVSVNGKDMGAVTTLTGLKTGDEIVVDFQKTAETKKAEVKAAAAKLSPIARSVKTAKGNIKVTLKFDKETESLIKEMQELGYTVKYKFYRSTKKSSGYKAMLTKSGRSYTNTNGKAGTKYYYKARVQIYDQDGKLIAQTALKQCQYASRTWTK